MLNLCRSIVVPLLAEWIEIEDLAYFDSACCNFRWRKFLCELVQSSDFTQNTTVLHTSMKYYTWLGVRNIKIRHLSLMELKDIEVYKNVVERILENTIQIKHLEVVYGPCLGALLMRFANKIESLDVHEDYDNEIDFDLDVETLVNIFSKLSGGNLLSLSCSSFILGNLDLLNFGIIAEYMTSLQILDFHSAGPWLCKLPNLKKIKFYMIDNDEELSYIANYCPLLEHLTVDEVVFEKGASDDSLILLSKNCPLLVHLCLFSKNFTDKSVVNLIESHPNMTHLDIAISSITDLSVMTMASSLKYLKFLCVQGCNRLTNNSMIQLSKKCVLLEDLNFNECVLLGDEVVLELSRNNHRLASLRCENCPKISDLYMDQLANSCTILRTLALFYTIVSNISLLCFVKNVEILCISQLLPIRYHQNILGFSFSKNSVISSEMNIHISCTLDTSSFINIVQQNCNTLMVIDLTLMHNLCDDIVVALLEHCPLLEAIHLTSCSLTTTVGIAELVRTPNKVHTLHLTDIAVTDDMLQIIVNNLTELKELKLCGCNNLTSTEVANLAQNGGYTMKESSDCIHRLRRSELEWTTVTQYSLSKVKK